MPSYPVRKLVLFKPASSNKWGFWDAFQNSHLFPTLIVRGYTFSDEVVTQFVIHLNAACTLQTPGDNSRFDDEIRLFSGVEDFDEHTVHVVSLDSVPEERHENEVVAHDVGDATTNT